jgi:DnaJ-domain-containing protein 1
MKNYYQILGLERNASKDEIKKAYRIYATKFHPDKQNGDKFFEERFKEILEAYEILSDDSKRANYDAKRTSDYSKGTSDNNRQSYSKYDSDINREREDREERERKEKERKEWERSVKFKQENEKRIHEDRLRERRTNIYYTSNDISVNGLYIYKDGKSYLLDNYDSVVLRKDDSSNFILTGIVLIIVGILTFGFFIGALLIVWGIYLLFYKEYFIVLVNEYGDMPLIKGGKQKMKRIANKINKAKYAK